MQLKALWVLIIISLAVVFTTCQNPLETGLGKKPDIQPPQLTVTSHSNGDYVKGAITVSGSAADDVQIDTVQLSLDNRATWVNATVNTTAKTWAYDIDTTTKTDARYNIIIKAKDASGKEMETGILLIFDNAPPLVLVKIPLVYQGTAQFNGLVSLKGEATDMFGISNVQIQVKKDNSVVLDWTDALGSASWSYNINSVLLALDGEIKIGVRAIDYANNTSSSFFHYADVLAANGSVPISIEQINIINDGGSVSGMTVTQSTLNGIKKNSNDAPLLLNINQSSDLPQFIISSPQHDDILGASARAVGMVMDDDGVNASSIEINVDGSGWNAVEPKSSDGLSVNWEYDLSGYTPTTHTLQLRANDVNVPPVTSTSDTVTFSINTGAPSLEILTPAQGSFMSSNFTMSGTASHGSGIDLVEVSTDGGANYYPATGTTGWLYTVDIDTPPIPDGPLTIKVRAHSGTEVATANLQVNIATIPPTINFITPSSGSSVNGAFNIQGTASVSGATLQSLTLKILKNGETLTTSGTYFWSSSFDSTMYDTSAYADEVPPASGRWLITLAATATDSAGNTVTSNHSFTIDQSTDWPVPLLTFPASVSAPYEIVGANAIIRGTVTDDDSVDSSTIAIKLDATAYTTTGVNTGSNGQNVSFNYTMPSVPDGQHTVRVRANDTVTSGLRESSEVTFIVDTQIPTFSLITPVQGSYRNVDFTVSGRTYDVNKISTVTVNVNGGGYVAADTLTQVVPGNDTEKSFTKTISTSSGSGTYTINIRSTDAAGKEALYTLDVIVDKTPPSLTFTNPTITIPATHITGKLDIKGTSTDNNKVNSVSVKIVKSDLDLAATGTYNWLVTNFTTGNYTNLTHADDIGGGLWSLTLRATVFDGAGNTSSSDLPVILDPGLNNPVITLTNVSLAGTTILESNPKILGFINDNDGVFKMEISLNGGAFSDMGATGNALTVPFTKDVNALADGLHTLQIKVTDINIPPMVTTTDTIDFRIDRNAPTLSITSPPSNSQQKQNFAIGGQSDDLNGVTSVQVKVDSGAFQDATYTTPPSWNFNVDISALTQGAHTLTVQAIDLSGKTTTLSRDFIKDTAGPVITVTDPSNASEQFGTVSFKGTTTDANAVTSVEISIGKVVNWQAVTGIYSWTYAIDNIDIFANPTYADETPAGSGIWKLTVHIRAADFATNMSTKDDYYVNLVPANNKPIVSIVYPTDGQTLGGQVRIYGTAISQKGTINAVQMQIDYDNNGLYTDQNDFWDGLLPFTDGFTTSLWEDESVWVTVTGTNNWSQTINTVGEFYSKTPGQTKTIRFRIKATDTDGNISNPIEKSITFTNNVPTVENLKVEYAGKLADYNSGLIVSKNIIIRGVVKDSHSVSSIILTRFTPTGSAAEIIADAASVTYNGIVGGYDQYTLHIDVDTSALFPSASGQLSYSLKVTNDAQPNPYITYANINLQVDNIYPIAGYSASSDLVGTSYQLAGTAVDSGTVSGAEKIVVYMVRDESGTKYVYNPKLNNSRTTLSTTKQLMQGSVLEDVIYPEPTSASSVYRVSIDSLTEGGNDTVNHPDPPVQVGDNDGYNESFWLSGSTYNWWAEVNSYNIPDGPIEIHYVVFDKGGNGTHSMQSGFIKNHPPVVSKITLGTDINGDTTIGSLASGERQEFTTGYSATNYTARNLMLLFNITASGGNGTLSYSVKYGGTERNGTLTNNEFTITNFATIPDASANGASFTVRVYDSTVGGALEQVITVNMNIANSDTVFPTITLAPLATTDATSDPLTGGHIELNGESLYDSTDPDVSGTVVLRGHAHDDQRVKNFKMTIANFNLGAGLGTEATLAAWPQTNTNGAYGNLTISNVTLSQSGGHDFDWAYTWNTANITDQANTNISVTPKVEDFRTPAANSATATRSHDVVPYITNLLRSVGAEGTIRSKYGKYTIQQSEMGLVINGFNLSKIGTNWVRISNTLPAAQYETIPTGNVTANGSFTAFTISSFGGAVSYSGFLSVLVNNVESTNNKNDNNRDYNKEDDGKGIPLTLWRDDRYVHVWQTGGYFGTAGQSTNAEFPSMGINSTGGLYGSWLARGASRIYYAQPGVAMTSIYYSYDPPEYSDIYVDSNGYLNIAFLGNNFIGTWDCAESDDLGSLAVWSNSSNPPQQSSLTYTNRFHQFEKLCHNGLLLQFQRPKVARSGNNIHLVYYDMFTTSAKYGYVVSTNSSENEITSWINLDGTTDAEDTQNLSDATPARSASSGEYIAVDVDENGLPVVLYYDTTTQSLRLARGTDAVPNVATEWARQEVFQSGDPNKQYSGKYVTMKIDKTTGNLYAACYNISNGDLVYLYAPDADGTDYSFTMSTKIDTVGSVGAWADISLNGTTPYISYLNSSMIGTFSGLKMAYLNGSNWEYETVPINTAIQDANTNIEYKTGTTNWTCAIGYRGTNFDLTYLWPEKP